MLRAVFFQMSFLYNQEGQLLQQYGAVIMHRHLMVDSVDLRIIPVSVPNHRSLAVVGYQDLGYAAKILKHVDVGGDPGSLHLAFLRRR